MLPTEDLFVYVYVLVDDAISSGGIAIAPRPGPAPRCSDAELLSIALVRHLLAGAARPGSWPRWPATGRTCSRGCRIKRGEPAVRWLWAHSSSCGPCWRPGCPKMTASRSTPPRCRSSTPPGSAAPISGPARQLPDPRFTGKLRVRHSRYPSMTRSSSSAIRVVADGGSGSGWGCQPVTRCAARSGRAVRWAVARCRTRRPPLPGCLRRQAARAPGRCRSAHCGGSRRRGARSRPWCARTW